jgi:hypothetical protein
MPVPILEQRSFIRVPVEEQILHLAISVRRPVGRHTLEQLVPDVELGSQSVAASSTLALYGRLPDVAVGTMLPRVGANHIASTVVGHPLGGVFVGDA